MNAGDMRPGGPASVPTARRASGKPPRGRSAGPPRPAVDAGQAVDAEQAVDTGVLLSRVARGDEDAFAVLYDELSGPVYGLACRVVRDPAQAEEIAQEVLLEVWRTATRFDPARGSAAAWVLTIAHRRAVDRVRSAVAAAEREQRAVPRQAGQDDVAEAVQASLDRERVRRCLDGLTDLQRESITLAYYGGYSYREVAEILGSTLGTIKTRIRDGFIRMRDCLGVTW